MFIKIISILKNILALLSCLIFLLSFNAQAEIVISHWQEESSLTNVGKSGKVTIKAVVKNIPKNAYHDYFAISFDSKRKIHINQANFDDANVKYSFQKNKLKIFFADKKRNNEAFSISYSYQETYKKISKYLRQEFIFAPNWAKNAQAKVSLYFGPNLEIVSLNQNLKQIGNNLIYEDRVPEDGFRQLIKLTPKSSLWNVQINNKISSRSKIRSLNAQVPVYFLDSGQVTKNNLILSNPRAQNKTIKNDYYDFDYGKIKNIANVDININANIATGTYNKTRINRNPNKYLKIDKDDSFLLANIMAKIRNDDKYGDIPLYAKIGHFVNDYIKYDKSYVGKLLSLEEILAKKIGVCVEYAKLFNLLARMAGIPSVIVNGVAKGEYDKFEGHSWNMVYYNNKWIEVDPTWDLMSGSVSSSHIYFYEEGKKSISASWRSTKKNNSKISLDTDFKIKAL